MCTVGIERPYSFAFYIQFNGISSVEGENGRIHYEVVHGDRQGQFQVDPVTGVISIAQNLDREMISSYGKDR